MDPKSWITVPQAAEVLGIKPRTIYAYIYRAQVIPARALQKIGTGWIIKKDWVQKRQKRQQEEKR